MESLICQVSILVTVPSARSWSGIDSAVCWAPMLQLPPSAASWAQALVPCLGLQCCHHLREPALAASWAGAEEIWFHRQWLWWLGGALAFFGCTQGIWNFPGQGSNPRRNCHLSLFKDTTRFLTCCITAGTSCNFLNRFLQLGVSNNLFYSYIWVIRI